MLLFFVNSLRPINRKEFVFKCVFAGKAKKNISRFHWILFLPFVIERGGWGTRKMIEFYFSSKEGFFFLIFSRPSPVAGKYTSVTEKRRRSKLKI